MNEKETDRWIWQCQALTDLDQFIRAHGPKATHPLPVVIWTVGTERSLLAQLSTSDLAAPEILRMYAKVLRTSIRTRETSDRTILDVEGRIGQRENSAAEPRTKVYMRLVIFKDAEHSATKTPHATARA